MAICECRYRRGRAVFNPALENVSEDAAAEKSCEDIVACKKSGLWMSLKNKGMSEDEISRLAQAGMVLPDYQSNPRVATKEGMLELAKQSYAI